MFSRCLVSWLCHKPGLVESVGFFELGLCMYVVEGELRLTGALRILL